MSIWDLALLLSDITTILQLCRFLSPLYVTFFKEIPKKYMDRHSSSQECDAT